MNQIRGLTIQPLEIDGQTSPAFVFRASRQKQVLALIVGFILAIVSLSILLHTSRIAVAMDAPAIVIGGCAAVLLLLSIYGAVLNLKLLGKRLAQVALTSDGFCFSSATDSILVPWDEIDEISRIDIHESDQGKHFLGLLLYSPQKVPSLQSVLPQMESRRAQYGHDFVYGLRAFEASPNIIETATQIYFHHPELRGEIGTEAGLKSIQTHLEQNWRPPEPSSGLFHPSTHKGLMNPKLEEAIENLTQENSTSNRRKLFEILMETMFCLPTSGEGQNASILSAIELEDGTQVLQAFSDPAALRRWKLDSPSMIVLTAPVLFQKAIENNFVQIDINPAGPAGGSLSREEFTILAAGIIPD